MKIFTKTISILLFFLFVLSTKTILANGFDYYPGVGGFVRSDIVQSAYNLSSNNLRQNTESIHFYYESTGIYETVCSWYTQNNERLRVNQSEIHTVTFDVIKSTVFDRFQNKGLYVSGFNLMGFKEEMFQTGRTPTINDVCLGNKNQQGWITQVQFLEARETLYIVFNDVRTAIWINTY